MTARVQVSLAGRYALSAPLFRLLLPMLVGDALHAIKRMLESDAARGGVEELRD